MDANIFLVKKVIKDIIKVILEETILAVVLHQIDYLYPEKRLVQIPDI